MGARSEPHSHAQRPALSAPAGPWLPRFCNLPTLFAVMVVAELVALVVVFAPDPQLRALPARLGTVSVFVQWLALLSAVVLCSLRHVLERLPPRVAPIVAWAGAVLVSALGSAVVCAMDQELALGLTVPRGHGTRFVIGNAVICALIAAALLRYLFVLEQWRERVRATAKAQVDALQARIRPHFLFNSMNTIASLIPSRPRDAEQTVEDLSDLFRAALGSDERLATLGEELELVEHYLRIEKLRLGERLVVESDCSALPRDLALPRLLLQPLVENAIYHGIEPRAGGGVLSLRGHVADGFVEIVVTNPRPPDATQVRNGHALENVRERIGYHFGQHGTLRVDAQPEQFIASVRLPIAGKR